MEWHVWNFPDNIRVYFNDEFREHLFRLLKGIYRSRYRLAKILDLHPMTVKEYERGEHLGHRIFIPISVIKKIIELTKHHTPPIDIQIEKNISEIRLKGGRSLSVYDPVLPIKESKEFYSFVAHMIGDGCASKDHSPYYCGQSGALIDSFKKYLEIFGKFETRKYIREDGLVYLYFPTVIARIVQYLLDLRFTKPDKIPLYLFNTSNKYKIAFIRAFMDDEGSVTGNKIYATQKSKKILEQIKLLLKSLGIGTSKIYHKKIGYQFIILADSHEKYDYLIGFYHPEKSKLLEDIVEKRNSKPIPIKYRVLDLLQRKYPLTKYIIASDLGLRIESVEEALSSLYEKQKISCRHMSSRKPSLWHSKVSSA